VGVARQALQLLTSLGEESAESMVIIGGFALLGEVSVGLEVNVSMENALQDGCSPECRVRGSKAVVSKLAVCPHRLPYQVPSWYVRSDAAQLERVTHLPARVCNLATGLADYTRPLSVYENPGGHPTSSGQSAFVAF
jgi:hypothetical protein